MVTAPGRLSWHIFAYRVPCEPTRLRAAVWRRLRAAGAVYLASSVAALPASPAAERLLRRLRADIAGAGGSAQLLLSQAIAGEAGMIRLYNTARDEEYMQVITAGEDLLREIGSWAADGRGRITGRERADRELARITRLQENIRAKDVFGASQAPLASAALAKARAALGDSGGCAPGAADPAARD